jgi:hypothetical protein
MPVSNYMYATSITVSGAVVLAFVQRRGKYHWPAGRGETGIAGCADVAVLGCTPLDPADAGISLASRK